MFCIAEIITSYFCCTLLKMFLDFFRYTTIIIIIIICRTSLAEGQHTADSTVANYYALCNVYL